MASIVTRPWQRMRAAFARIALMVAQVGGVNLVIHPALGQCREHLPGRRRRREALSLEVQELRVDRLSFACTVVGACHLSTLQSGLGRHHQPTLGHPVVTPLTNLIAGLLIETNPPIQGKGWGDRL